MDFSLTNLLLGIIALALSAIAVKVKLSFDVNEYLKTRDEKLKQKARNYCPHGNFVKKNGTYGFRPSFTSPSGTMNWICTRCGLVQYNIHNEEERGQYFLAHPNEYEKKEKMFQKIAKKAGLL